MDTLLNASLQTVATGLAALGFLTIKTDLKTGAIEIVLGLLTYIVYELWPSTNHPPSTTPLA